MLRKYNNTNPLFRMNDDRPWGEYIHATDCEDIKNLIRTLTGMPENQSSVDLIFQALPTLSVNELQTLLNWIPWPFAQRRENISSQLIVIINNIRAEIQTLLDETSQNQQSIEFVQMR